MQKNNCLILKKLKNTESAQLWSWDAQCGCETWRNKAPECQNTNPAVSVLLQERLQWRRQFPQSAHKDIPHLSFHFWPGQGNLCVCVCDVTTNTGHIQQLHVCVCVCVGIHHLHGSHPHNHINCFVWYVFPNIFATIAQWCFALHCSTSVPGFSLSMVSQQRSVWIFR